MVSLSWSKLLTGYAHRSAISTTKRVAAFSSYFRDNISTITRARAIRFASTATNSTIWQRFSSSYIRIRKLTFSKANVLGLSAASATSSIPFYLRGGISLRGFSSSTQEPIDNNPKIFDAGVSVFPHPDKVQKGGEDAYFISTDGLVLGVADGVGGWAEVGVDPAIYSKALMKGSKDFTKTPNYSKDPVDIMSAGYTISTDIVGSSTCCICVLDGGYLRCANLGDSGFMVIRRNQVHFRSREQQHSFNFPYQLGSQSSDRPEAAILDNVPILDGDLVIVGTDGLFDNLYDREILEIACSSTNPHQIAEKIAKKAQEVGKKTKGVSPFADGARKIGYDYQGGKLDDVTVVVARVCKVAPQLDA